MTDPPTNGYSRWWNLLDWPGAIAFTLSCGLSLSMVLIVIGGMMAGQMSEHGANLLSTMFGAALGALATYLGQAGQARRNGKAP